MQHDVFVHPLRSARRSYPYLVNLQSDFVQDANRTCAPMVHAKLVSMHRGAPLIEFDGREYILLLMKLASAPLLMLRRPVVSIAPHRDSIVYALDWLFTGI